MFNKTARQLLDERLSKVQTTPPGDLVATEAELGYAAGMAAYALSCGDISHEEHNLINMRIDMARLGAVARQCRQYRAERTGTQ
ncbi:hypothetical protein [Pseudomonas vranovensis]|uniref:hypothetical protein n=1 Tax=Pseudomonas vranovensis TaxID=321661 RepID=UPI003D98077E